MPQLGQVVLEGCRERDFMAASAEDAGMMMVYRMMVVGAILTSFH